MIHATIKQDGDEFVVAIPPEAMATYQLTVGDTIAFHPVRLERALSLREDVQQALDIVIERDQDALEYLRQS